MSLESTVEDLVRGYGYPALAGVVLVENLFPPIPSEVVLPLAGYQVSRGVLGFGWSVVAATIGSVVGALLLYWLGRRGGRPAVLRYGRVLRVTDDDLDRVDAAAWSRPCCSAGWYPAYAASCRSPRGCSACRCCASRC